MKQVLIVFAMLTSLSAQAQISFKKVYGDSAIAEYGQAVLQAADSGYFVAGARVTGTGPFVGEGVLMRTDKYGNELWTKYYSTPGSSDLTFDHMQWTSDGDLILTGVAVYGNADYDVYITKMDTAGVVLWYGDYAAPYRQRGLQIKQTSDNGFVIGGWNESLGTAISNFYVIRTNSTGDTLWTRNYPNGMQQYGNAVEQTTDGGFAIVGSIQQPTLQGTTMYIIKTDANGDTLWTRKMDTLNFGNAYDLKAIANNHIVVAGYTTLNGCSQPVLLELDGSGNLLWREIYTNSSCGWAHSVCKTDDGGYALFGMDAVSDHYLVKTDDMGGQEWYRKFHTSSTDYGYGVSQTSDGGYIMTGITGNTNISNMILIKVDGDGELLSVGTQPVTAGLRIYPNPATDLVHISTKKGGEVLSVQLYDVAGRSVLQSGLGTDAIDVSGHSKGLYLLQILTTGGAVNYKILVE